MDPQYCANELAAMHGGGRTQAVTLIGGGFYGRVFLAEYADLAPLIVKLYLVDDMHRMEADQLEVLRKVALVPMPRVYRVWDKDESIAMNGLIMEYLPGENAGVVNVTDAADRARIGDCIIENLIAYHSTKNPLGFGTIKAAAFAPDWNAYYKKIALSHFNKAKLLYERGIIDGRVFSAAEQGMKRYDQIFCLPVKEACLIHGDYNTWNVLLNRQLNQVAAVIDPAGCSWADPELDLYQLHNANGDSYDLFTRYQKRRSLSDNFYLKNAFYELMTELMHYHDSGVDPKEYYDKLLSQAQALDTSIVQAGIGWQ